LRQSIGNEEGYTFYPIAYNTPNATAPQRARLIIGNA
jgi:hypothetical protein